CLPAMVQLYALGSNSGGQLGVGHAGDSAHPVPCIFAHSENSGNALPLPWAQSWRKMTSGGNHAAALTADGTVYVCGSNADGQLGLNLPFTTTLLHWTPLPPPPTKALDHPTHSIDASIHNQTLWHDVACGWNHTLLVDNHGAMYACGSTTFGQLGLGPDSRVTPKVNCPTRVLLPPDDSTGSQLSEQVVIVEVTCGLRHSVALDSQGRVWGWGAHRHGQLGPWDDSLDSKSLKRHYATPQRIHGIPLAQQVACGQHHTLILGRDSSLWVLGNNKYGQLGYQTPLSPSSSDALARKLATFPRHPDQIITKIAAGWSHNLALDTQGHVWAWGRCDRGQLGQPEASVASVRCLAEPVKVQFNRETGSHSQATTPSGIVDICCGSEHAVALTGDGGCYTWGWNEHGNCGLETLKDVFLPRALGIFDQTLGQGQVIATATSVSPENGRIVKQIGGGYGVTFIVI
ncbi:alpha tubulin suppressor, partial [Dimargaris xerosporica]